MERVNLSRQNSFYKLQDNKKNSPKPVPLTCQNNSYVYPVYSEIPYGINRKNYFKIAETKLPTGETAHIYKLINGQTISIVQKPDGCPIISSIFAVGALDEPDGKEGISHLIEHSVFHESKKYPDVDASIKALGSYSNASTSDSETKYYIKLSDNNKEMLEKAIDIEADMLFNPKFSKVEEKEKEIVIKEVKETEENEEGVLFVQCGKNLYSINKPNIKSLTAGCEDSVRNMSVDDMFQYHKYYYIPSNCSTTIVSSFNPDEVIEIASKKFLEASKDVTNHPIERKKYNAPNGIIRSDLISKISSKKKTVISFGLPDKTLKDDVKLSVIAKLLTLRKDIVALFCRDYNDSCIFYTEDDVLDEYSFFEKLKEAIEDIKTNPVTEDELKEIKSNISDDLKKDFLTNESIAQDLSSDCLRGDYNYSEQIKVLNNLSNKDIQEAIKQFDLSKASIQVLHSKNTTQKDLDDGLLNYKNYITPFSIPKNTVKLDVLRNMESYNIHPYSAKNVKTTILPDNTRYCVVDNIKTDDCRVRWELYNPDLSSFNPAAKFMLDYFAGKLTIEDVLSNKQNEVHIFSDFGDSNKVVVNLSCKSKDLKDSLKQIKKLLTVDFNEKDFKIGKQEIIDKLKNDDSNSALSKFLAERSGLNSTQDKEKLIEEFEKLTYNDVKRYYNALFNGSYSTLCAKIPFENNLQAINDIASEINTPNHFFKKEDENKVQKIYNPLLSPKVYMQEKNQPKYGLCYSFKINNNKADSLKFKILGSIISKRIFDTLREKYQFGYQAGAVIDEFEDMGMIRPYIVTDHRDEETISKIFAQFKDIVKDTTSKPVSPDELKEAKAELKMDYYDLEESTYDYIDDNYEILDEINNALKVSGGLAQMQNNLKMIDSVTQEDILKTAQYVFKNKPDCLIEADKATLDRNKEFFNSLI